MSSPLGALPKFTKIGKTKSVSRVAGTATIDVYVSGAPAIRRALAGWLEPELTAHLDASTKAAAKTLAKAVKAEARPVSRHMARAVRVRRAKTGKPGWVVGSSRKIAFFWPFVIGGTKRHGPSRRKALVFVPGWNPYLGTSSHGVGNKWVRASSVAGVPPNDIVERAANKSEDAAMRDVDSQMTRSTGI